MESTSSSSQPGPATITTYPGPPSVSLTPATPPAPWSPTLLGPPITTSSPSKSSDHPPPPPPPVERVEREEMREKAQPTVSETALVADPPAPAPPNQDLSLEAEEPPANSGPFQNLTRRLSGKSAPSPAMSSPPMSAAPAEALKVDEKMPSTPPTKPITPPLQPSMTAKPVSPTVMPAPTSTQKAAQKKRRKRTGIAGFFAALGCLSSREIEEDEKPSAESVMAQKPASGTTKAATTTPVSTAGAGPSTGANVLPTIHERDQMETTGTSGTTGTTLAGGEGDKDRSAAADGVAPGDELVVAPVEPVTLPDDEVSGTFDSLPLPPKLPMLTKADVLRPRV